ncbi:MAG: C40 family peptidase [Eubacterium sp.]|nr:C40 family peptidase [Eubacterium sp.]
MYKPSKRVMVVGLAAGLLASSVGVVPNVQAKGQNYDSSNVGIADKVGDYIQNGASADPIADLTSGKVTTADVQASFKAEAKKKEEKKNAATTTDAPKTKPTDAKVYPQFQDRAVVAADDSVNIRKEASTDSEVVGTLQRGGICLVDEIGKEWSKIESGSCVGYIANQFLKYGDDAGDWSDHNDIMRYATVNTETLKVRESKDESSNCVTLIPKGEEFYVYSNSGEWIELYIDDDLRGFVKSEYVDVRYDNPRAISVEEQEEINRQIEEEKRLAQEEADRAWLEYLAGQNEKTVVATDDVDEDTIPTTDSEEVSLALGNEDETTEPSNDEDVSENDDTTTSDEDASEETSSNDEDEAPAEETPAETPAETPEETPAEEPAEESPAPAPAVPASASGQALVDYALQFVGNPYVWGGEDPNTGADCSGFVMYLVYNLAGISLPHDAELQANYGTEVNLSEIQPGDLLFYAGGGYAIGHVAIYMGDGQIVHASNSAPYPVGGIKVGNYDYRTPCKAVRIMP